MFGTVFGVNFVTLSMTCSVRLKAPVGAGLTAETFLFLADPQFLLPHRWELAVIQTVVRMADMGRNRSLSPLDRLTVGKVGGSRDTRGYIKNSLLCRDSGVGPDEGRLRKRYQTE
ncbi:MAG: hypothetical protein K2W95_36020 [Candidatus Obscuribacterales bacterium]|nr:hypothetical protein [Candidatus Obscuribacterales bacterium]